MIKLAIFDLDGTLLNTIEDLAESTNYALEQCGFPKHNIKEYNYFVGNGIKKLFERALPQKERNETNINLIRKHFLYHYNTHNTNHTRPYPGINDVLIQMQQSGILIAVASNKYQEATENLIHFYFGKHINFIAILGQREGIPTKPDPFIVTEILNKANVSANNSIYIGDSNVDMETAKSSNIISVGVTWGFRTEKELLESGANYIAHKTKDIINICQKL